MAHSFAVIRVYGPGQQDPLKFYATRNVLFTNPDHVGGFSYWEEEFFFDYRLYVEKKKGVMVEYAAPQNQGKQLNYVFEGRDTIQVDLFGRGPVRFTKQGYKTTCVEIPGHQVAKFMTGLNELVKVGTEHPELAFAADRLEELARNKLKYKNKQGGGGGSVGGGGKSFGGIKPSFGTPRIVNRPATPYYESANREIEFFQQQQQAINQPVQQQGFAREHYQAGHVQQQAFGQPQLVFNQQPQQVFGQQATQGFNQPNRMFAVRAPQLDTKQPSHHQMFKRPAQPHYDQPQQGQVQQQGFNQPTQSPQYHLQPTNQQAGQVVQTPVRVWVDLLDIPPPRSPSPVVSELEWTLPKFHEDFNEVVAFKEAELANRHLVQADIKIKTEPVEKENAMQPSTSNARPSPNNMPNASHDKKLVDEFPLSDPRIIRTADQQKRKNGFDSESADIKVLGKKPKKN